MPFDTTSKHIMLAELATYITRISLHTDDPGNDFYNEDNFETTAARQAPVWATPTGGELSLASNLVFTGGAANGPVVWIALWDTQDPPIRYGKAQLAGVNTFDGGGTFILTTGTRFRIAD